MKVPYIELDPYVQFMTAEEHQAKAMAAEGDGMVEISHERLNQLRTQKSAHNCDLGATL